MAFSWSNNSVAGQFIDDALVVEMRNKLDWLDNNIVCRTHNSQVDNAQDASYCTTYYVTILNSKQLTVQSFACPNDFGRNWTSYYAGNWGAYDGSLSTG